MPPISKAIVGLVLALLAGWAWHGPLGQGERLIDGLEARATEAVANAELPGIQVRLGRHPLARVAFLSGAANDLQREGLGSQLGISDYVRAVPGIGSVRWSDEPDAKRWVVPLLAETLAWTALAYFIGLGVGWLLWGRRRRQGFV